ncbi:hypothetical protein [Thermoflavimicrobium daqui]|uniref:Uncharacterized protein n=1 Tax=Thermoflavimicrobium daqui TaxID=2137476 RepID=A0A364K0Y1_9BACL|nr:hypothetical protein [Thermoflavimicrobium daqui]RAL21080.1 hypothetical protein DL897_17090 [Thermoflavimicrobium daqui]
MSKFKMSLAIGLTIIALGVSIPFAFSQTTQSKKEQVTNLPIAKVSDLPQEEQERIKEQINMAKKKGIYSNRNSKCGDIKNLNMEKVKKLPDHASIGSNGCVDPSLPKKSK